MANGSQSHTPEEFVIRSGVRSGLKREFAFAVKSQSNLSWSLPRTRSGNPSPYFISPSRSLEKRLDDSVEDSILVDVEVEDLNEDIDVTETSTILVEPIDILKGSNGLHEINVVLEKQQPLKKRYKQSLLSDSIIKQEEQNPDTENGESDLDEVFLPSRRFTRSLLKADDTSGTTSCSSGSIGSNDRISVNTKPSNKMELKMSKKITLNKIPSNVGQLISTRLLEGMPVKYDTRVGKRIQLDGVVSGNGILCSCSQCRCCKTVSAFNFELHAGSTKKHPADYIFLKNGKSMRDILRACSSAPLDMLTSVIQNAIGEAPSSKLSTCQKCEEIFHTPRVGKFAAMCNKCLEPGKLHSQVTPITTELRKRVHRGMSNKSYPQKKKILRTRAEGEADSDSSSERVSSWKKVMEEDDSDSSSKKFSSRKKVGRITRKDIGLHKLVFMDDILPEGTEVGYFVRGQKLLEGYIKDQAIYCHHCDSVVSPSTFEAHAGRASRRKPYNNIYTSNGVSLHELAVSLSKGRARKANENDDLCSICADGGDLLLCDLCPRAFHPECAGLSSIPTDAYECRYCQLMHEREKSVACNDNAIAAGRVAGVDPIEQIIQRCIRIVNTSTDISCCVLCKCHDFSRSTFDDRTVIICDQCEKEYHIGCLRENNMCDLKELPKENWFCCGDCSSIHATLQNLLLKPHPVPSEYIDIIKKRHEKIGLEYDEGNNIRWRLINGKLSTADTKLLLSESVTIFHGSFSPIVDAAGRDLIPSMVYGREGRDQDYGGVYSAVLTVNSSVVSVGILRILGSVAELPLVATSKDFQGLGYFQSLFSCIENLLVHLKVKHFVLPSAEESKAIWVEKFGFTKINADQLQTYAEGAHLMMFEGTSWLHKPVPDERQ